MSRLPSVLTFDGTDLRVFARDGQQWFSGVEISRALGYARDEHVSRIYQRNQHEFKSNMTQVISLQANELNQNVKLAFGEKRKPSPPHNVRIFSLRGAHLIGMFAQTAKAAAFRSWVLDVLEELTTAPPVPVAPATPVAAPASLAAQIADNLTGPALSEIPAIMNACAQRLSGAMCLPHLPSAPAPSELAEVVAHSRALTRKQRDAITVAALQRLATERGSHGVQQLLREVNADYLLVNESELILNLYRARSLPQGAL